MSDLPARKMCVACERRVAKQPSGYVARAEWMEQKARTHDQERCPDRGYWTIWKRRPAAPPVSSSARSETT